jgi:hypothetical protein
MPSNAQYADLLDELKASIDPMDAATLFAGMRNTVPLSMLFRHGELGPDEMTDLAKRRGPATMPAPPTIDPAESNRRAQMDFEMQYPDPRIRQLLIDEMLKQARDPYSPTTATRRRDFEDAPMSAQHYMSAAPKKRKFANGGAIDFSTPDMADGGRFLPDAQPFNKGGSAKKTLDQMMAEMAQKGVKVADKPDLARRSLFGLGSQPAFPLVNLDTKALEKMQSQLKGAPAITEKSVTIDPGKGAAKSTLKSISETPVSRREVLKSAAGQAVRGVLPDLGALSTMGNVAKAVESVPKAVPAMPETLQGLIAHFAKKGLDEDDTIRMLEKLGHDEDDVLYMLNPMRNPDEFISDLGEEAMSPARALSNLINSGTNKPPMTMRGPLREIKRENPAMYNDLLRAARDISEYGFE